MQITSLVDMTGGRLEGLPSRKDLVVVLNSKQNSSTKQKISVILA